MEPGQPTVPLLAVRGVAKRFGAVQALADVDLDFDAGTVHAILGENGAGKSTLVNILGGVRRADAGRVLIAGVPVQLRSPRAARRAGIGMVHQHFTVVEALTVAENLALSLPRRTWRLDTRALAAQVRALAAEVGLDPGPLAATVAGLPVGARQRLEILKALAAARRVLILDEPTAVLTPPEAHQLFAMVRRLRVAGRAVLFITHKLREVKEVADRVTIMRRGRVVGTDDVDALSEREMAERMVGALPPERRRVSAARDTVALRVTGLSAAGARGAAALAGVNFAVRAGEVFGVAGVDGNGQRELFDILVGLRSPLGGVVEVGDRVLRTFSPGAALAAGIAHIPPDRQREGLVLPMTLAENLILGHEHLACLGRRGLLSPHAVRRFAAGLAQQYAVQAAGLDAAARSLSGGNQQRVVVARALAQRPAVLVAVNPTRGLDVGAAAAVAAALVEVAGRGCAIVLISTDLDEVLELSDRVSVLFRGQLSAPLQPPIDPERLGRLLAGAAA